MENDEDYHDSRADDRLDTFSNLFTSSTKRRIAQLHSFRSLITNQGLTNDEQSTLFRSLVLTHSFYVDRESRKAVQGCLDSLFASPNGSSHLTHLVDFLQTESNKAVIAPASIFVLVEWCSISLEHVSTNRELWDSFGVRLVSQHAKLLERCIGSHGKRTFKRSAFIVTFRSLRLLFRNGHLRRKALDDSVAQLTMKQAQSTALHAVFLGAVAGVCARDDAMSPMLSEKTPEYYAFYSREILGSRTPVPPHVSNGLNDFFKSFATLEGIMRDVAPVAEKALLRTPEVSCHLIAPLVESLPNSMDLSDALKLHLQKPLLSNIKSTNATIREATFAAFEALISRCGNVDVLSTLLDEILKALKDAKSTDQRSLYASMLAAVRPTSLSREKILPALANILVKESNEAAIQSEARAMSLHLPHSFSEGVAIEPSVTKAFVQGLSDKKHNIRRSWALQLGELIWYIPADQIYNAGVVHFLETIFEALVASWDEILSNPVTAAQSGLISVGYVLTAIAPQLRDIRSAKLSRSMGKIFNTQLLLGSQEKLSFLCNPRVYNKLGQAPDQLWFVRALSSASVFFSEGTVTATTGSGWARAILFMLTAASTTHDIRKTLKDTIFLSFLQAPGVVASLIIDAIWDCLCHGEVGDKDPTQTIPAKSSAKSHIHLAILAICPSLDEQAKIHEDVPGDVIHQSLIRLLPLCRPPLIETIRWIDLCLRCGVDPKRLVVENAELCMRQVVTCSSSRSNMRNIQIHLAACDAAAELAFVAPDIITPLVTDLFASELQRSGLRNVGPTEAGIFRTQEGIMFVDVLSDKKQDPIPDKKGRDYETMKWEQELRAQLAQKQGAQTKLTADEELKVKAQLEKETKIRDEVAAVEAKLYRGIGIIAGLARGPPTDVETWMGPALDSLLEVIVHGAGSIIGDAPSLAYIECAQKVSDRLGSLRTFVGVATLRAHGSSELPENLLEEDLGDLVTRLLYRLRFSGEQRSFDSVSFIYVLPLIAFVLQNGGVARKTPEEADEHITLALEFLSYHVEMFSSSQLPREKMAYILITCMQKHNQHYRLLKECLLGICQALAVNASDSEIGVFLKACIVPESSVRGFALHAIDAELELNEGSFCPEIWLACHDDGEENRQIATDIWADNSLQMDKNSAFEVLPYTSSTDISLRRSASRGLASCVREQKSILTDMIGRLESLYLETSIEQEPERDAYGMPRKSAPNDPWEARHGVALSFSDLASSFDDNELVPFVEFLVKKGPLADKDFRVRDQMIEAATNLISLRGKMKLEELLKIFEDTLEAPNSGSKDHDQVNEAVVILYGALGRHLQPGDTRIPEVINRLLSTLSTPSETVQYAIAGCLPPLLQISSGSDTSEHVQRVMTDLTQSKNYATRRGAAYGLAGIVRGKGISSLREYRILSTLKGSTEDKKDPNRRQGAFLAYELLSLILGQIFEPYGIEIVPQLLTGFGDSSGDVREACLDAAKTCFATLSSFGVKQILPTLLAGLDEQQWRSKKGACDSLGAMAYLDPQQLAISLPEIIPPLTNVLNDSHKEVRAAANKSLQRFGEVINNPEIKSVVSVLLKALSDPTKHTEEALDALLKLSFIHYLDAPSLALVVRILQRGLGDRSNTKRKSSQIIGSLTHLADRKDLISHLPILVSGLRVGAVDPVPTTRATSSKALGSLVEKLGEDALPDLIPSLMSTLKTDTGAGDRLGSAQALSEVLAGLGIARLEETLPSILQNVSSAKPAVREGFMSLFIFLPACFGNSFANYLNRIIPPILSGLADDVETIRETSLRAGRLLVKNFATKAIDLLLPELQQGLADDNYRIRLSSVELVGDLLFNLTGISAKSEDNEDELLEEGATVAGQSLLEVLGEDRRNNILSALYISRCDTSALVRAAAINVWKALVATPRTLKEITPTLTQVIIRRLASSNMEQKVIAGNALGELIRKAGEGVLSNLIPTLEEGLETTTDTDAKQGICIALRELVTSAAPDSLEDYEAKLISVVRKALIDQNPDVREASAEAFDSMQRLFGKRVIDQILPKLLGSLRDESEAENSLAALLTLLTEHTRSNIILPSLLPTLLGSPISTFNARALASLAAVAGQAMTRRLSTILNTLQDNIVTCQDDRERLESLDGAFDAVLLSVDEFDGLNTVMSIMLALLKHDDHRKRASAASHLAIFFARTDIDYSRYYADLVRILLISFDDSDQEVVRSSWTALNTLTGQLRKEDMENLAIPTRQTLTQVGVAGHYLPGFSLPKGINAILPIFLQGLINGTSDQRTQSALAISDIIDRTSGESLKPFVTQITGPLIRVVSERSVEVKAAILLTLNNLLEKIPTFLKPFIPQLQRTFTKALADTSSDVLRSRAAKALGTLITMTPRIDPLLGELVTGAKTSDPGVKNAMQKALFEVVGKVGANMGEGSRTAIISLIDEDADSPDESMAITNARLFGVLINSLNQDVANALVKNRVLITTHSRSSVLALNAVLLESPKPLTETFSAETVSIICRGIRSSESLISENCVLAAGKYLLTESTNKNFEVTKPISEAITDVVQPGTPIDTRRLGLVVIRTVSRQHPELIRPHLALLAPAIFANVRDHVIPIKLTAEAAFLEVFRVAEEENAVFEKYVAGAGANLAPNTKRSMQDYFKRVAVRLGAQARERKEAEGGQGGLGLSNDEKEDEREIWSIGKVDLGESGAFSDTS